MREKLTGRKRHRLQKRTFGEPLLVLQVEVDVSDGPDDYNGMPTSLARRYFRDAKLEDLTLDTFKD